MNLRWPGIPADTPHNRFGWRHEGAGPQLDDDPGAGEPLLDERRFDHPQLKKRPPYVPPAMARRSFAFKVRKGCAGLAHEYRKEPEGVYERIVARGLDAGDGTVIRWMIGGLRTDEDFVRLHTVCRLSIEELAYMVRFAFAKDSAPYRTWLNQWAREPSRPMPSLPECIELKSGDELAGLHVDDIAPGDERRIDIAGTTYLKLNAHMYWLRREQP